MTKSSIIPTEDWAPYKALWSRYLVLSRDAEGNARPYTHGMRAHWITFLAVVVLVFIACVWFSKRHWYIAVPVALLTGLLAGHVLWAGQPLGASL